MSVYVYAYVYVYVCVSVCMCVRKMSVYVYACQWCGGKGVRGGTYRVLGGGFLHPFLTDDRWTLIARLQRD